MGDADHEVVVPAQEVEEWMDEALDVVDEGLGSLLEFMALLNACTNEFSAQLKKMENFHRCFTAMQLLIVPIAIAIFLCYGTSELNNPKQISKTSYVVDGIVTLLLFISGGIGLPYYLLSTWEYYCQDEQAKEDISTCGKDNTQLFEAIPTTSENFNFLSSELSMERLNDIARQLRSRHLERAPTEADLTSFIQCVECTQKAETNGSDDVKQSTDIPESLYEVKDASEIDGKGNAVSFPILYQFQIRMREESPDLNIKIEPQDAEKVDLLGDGLSENGIRLATKQQENLSNETDTSTSLI